jgi:membrane protein required for colicin V production
MATTFNTLDLIFLAFTAIFVLTAVLRGFVKEIFALFNWVISLTISYFLTPYITNFLAAHFESKIAVDLVARSGVFALVFLITAFSTSGLRDSFYKKMPRVFDRSLGLLFGFVKTLLIFGVIYSTYFNAYDLVLGNKLKDTKKEPEWLEKAKCRSLLKASGEMVGPITTKFFEAISQNFDHVMPKPEDLLKNKIDEIIKEKSVGDADGAAITDGAAIDENAKPMTDEELKAMGDSGYNKKNIEKMNQLIEIINK